MSVQSEAALENGLIATLKSMNYEYVQIDEEVNLKTNFKKQLEIHNKKQLAEFGRTEFNYLQKEQPDIIQNALKEKHLGLSARRITLSRILIKMSSIIKTFSWD